MQNFCIFGGATACNVFVMAGHGWSKPSEQWFLQQLSNHPEMRGKPVMGAPCSPLVGSSCCWNAWQVSSTDQLLHKLLEAMRSSASNGHIFCIYVQASQILMVLASSSLKWAESASEYKCTGNALGAHAALPWLLMPQMPAAELNTAVCAGTLCRACSGSA